jgi:hypothetical protein
MLARAVGNAAPICSLGHLYGSPPPIAISPNEPRPDWLEVNLLHWYPELEKSWELTKEGIRGIRRYCDERGIELYVYVLPSLTELSPKSFRSAVSHSADPEAYEYGKGVRLAEEFFREEGLISIDVQTFILEQGNPELAFYLWDGHLTPKGAKEVARAISRRLRGTSKIFDNNYSVVGPVSPSNRTLEQSTLERQLGVDNTPSSFYDLSNAATLTWSLQN